MAWGTVQFIAVGTPPDEDGSADLKYVVAAARNIGRHMKAPRIVVDKSTVPVGTADKVAINEVIELAKQYADEEAARFINGILGSAVANIDHLRASLKGQESA